MKLTPEFLFAGKAIFTVELSKALAQKYRRPHFTFMVAPRRGYGAGVYGVMLLLRGAEYPRLNRWLGTLGRQGQFAPASYAEVAPCEFFAAALAVILGGSMAFEKFHETGCNLHPAGRCCRCCRALTAPASIETGIGPECELYVKLGIARLDEVPCMTDRTVATLQYAYWTNSDKATLAALKDACLDAWGDEDKANLLVEATKKTMRKFKKVEGRRDTLPWRFVNFVKGV